MNDSDGGSSCPQDRPVQSASQPEEPGQPTNVLAAVIAYKTEKRAI